MNFDCVKVSCLKPVFVFKSASIYCDLKAQPRFFYTKFAKN